MRTVETHFAGNPRDVPFSLTFLLSEDGDLELAAAAWRWLEETELLAPDLDAVPGGGPVVEEDEAPKVWTPAWQLGLPLGHLAIHLF